MSYDNWKGYPDSTDMLGGIVDNETVNNAVFMNHYVGEKFSDLVSILGNKPNHQSTSVYRAGGRAGFPLYQISSNFMDTTNTIDHRYLEIRETIPELFEVSGTSLGDKIYGTFGVRFSGSNFFAIWSGLSAIQRGNGNYSVHVDRAIPNYSEGTIPNFNTSTYTDSSSFEVFFQGASASGSGSGLTGNAAVFGLPGSGSQYTDWDTMIDTIYPYLDSTNRYTVYVMPGVYDMNNFDWVRKDMVNPDSGLQDRAYWGKLYVPPFVDVVGISKFSTRFTFDTTEASAVLQSGTYNPDGSSSFPHKAVFLASQYSTINNLTIHVHTGHKEFNGSTNVGYYLHLGRFLPPNAVSFMVDGSTDMVYNLGVGNPRDYGNESGSDDPYVSPVSSLESPVIFQMDNVHFIMSGDGNSYSNIFNSGWRIATSSVTDYMPPTLRNGVVDAKFKAIFNNCSVKESRYGLNRPLHYGTVYPGETFLSDYLDLEFNNLDYEQTFAMPSSGVDSTTWPVNKPSHGFLIAYQGYHSFPLTKRFNNCSFSSPNRFMLDPDVPDSTSVIANYWVYKDLKLVAEESAAHQALTRPGLIHIVSERNIDDREENFHKTEFNNCKIYVRSRNHPQKGNRSRLFASNRFVSEFCVAIDNSYHDVVFNNCDIINHTNSPYSGLISIGLFNYTTATSPCNLGSVYLNNCNSESYGMGIHKTAINNLLPTSPTPFHNVYINGGSFTTYKSPMLLSEKSVIATGNYYRDSIHFAARNATFCFVPYHMGTTMVSVNPDSTENVLPLWVDSTTIMGIFHFDSTGDSFVFDNCWFTTRNYGNFNGPTSFDSFTLMKADNNKFGAWIFTGTGSPADSTNFTQNYHQVVDCKFTSNLLHAFVKNPHSANKAPVVVDNCVFAYDSSSDLEGQIYFVGVNASASKFGSYYTRSYPHKAVNYDFLI